MHILEVAEHCSVERQSLLHPRWSSGVISLTPQNIQFVHTFVHETMYDTNSNRQQHWLNATNVPSVRTCTSFCKGLYHFNSTTEFSTGFWLLIFFHSFTYHIIDEKSTILPKLNACCNFTISFLWLTVGHSSCIALRWQDDGIHIKEISFQMRYSQSGKLTLHRWRINIAPMTN